jgi:gluconate 2-dehydrogenase gamma chain
MTMPTSAKRRALLQFVGTAPLVAGLTVEAAFAAGAHAAAALGAAAAGKVYEPKFFTAHEWQTVRLLADAILPKDERSGSASDAGVPEFMDFIMTDPAVDDRSREARQVSMRGGLAWLDNQSRQGSGKAFVAATEAERTKLLDAVAYWKGDDPEEYEDHPTDKRVLPMAHGPAFFNSFRDLTASGFFSSKMGVADLGYMGNTAFNWTGPPPEVMKKLGE